MDSAPDSRCSARRLIGPTLTGRGFDTTFPDGSHSSSHPNIFGGEDTTTPKGTIESKPDIFGGKDYRFPSGERIESRPNIFGGQDFRLPGGVSITVSSERVRCQDCRWPVKSGGGNRRVLL